jgi:HAD superfamily hydrolase (TIGR01549 family)
MIKVVSFDIDGTLMDFNYNIAFWDEAIPNLYSKRHDVSLDEAKKIFSDDAKKMGQNDVRWYQPSFWFKKYDIGDHKKLMRNLKNRINFYPDSIPTLRVVNKNFKIIAITGNNKEFLEIKLEAENLGNFFSKCYSVIDDFGGVKTPNVFRKISKDLGVLPNEIVHVGDDPEFDYIKPRSVGINAFLVDRNDKHDVFKKDEHRKKVPNVHIIKDLSQLFKKIEAIEKELKGT